MLCLPNPVQARRLGVREGISMDQKEKNLEYLNHYLQNNVACIQGCMRQIENHLRDMRYAWEKYRISIDAEEVIEK